MILVVLTLGLSEEAKGKTRQNFQISKIVLCEKKLKRLDLNGGTGFSPQVQKLEFIIHSMAETDRDYTNA